MKHFLIMIPLCLVLFSCNNSPNDEKSASAAPQSDSSVNAMAMDSITAEKKVQSEQNDFSFLAKDKMKVVYGPYLDTIYGFRAPGSDTLHVEGDILMLYPVAGAKGIGAANQLWPLFGNKIQIPFVINEGYPDSILIFTAIKAWQDSLPLQFIRRRKSDVDYIEFMPSIYTQSFVGKQRGRQTIEINSEANAFNIAHEIGHALGLYHEMTRSDRDRFVSIRCADDINYKHAYKSNPYAIDFGPYNYYSIMHYPVSNCMRIIPQPGQRPLPLHIPGQRDSITRLDYYTIRALYKLNH
jgi:hypothetical protein